MRIRRSEIFSFNYTEKWVLAHSSAPIGELVVPKYSNFHSKAQGAFMCPKFYNSLPTSVRIEKKIGTFKKKLNEWLEGQSDQISFQVSYYLCFIPNIRLLKF